jgi:hypothetical protein
MSEPKDDPISRTLGLAPMQEVLPAVNITQVDPTQISDDFEYARGNLVSTIEKGQEALTGILDVAAQSQHPRSYEVVATLMNSLVAANKDLMELQKRKKDLLKQDEGGPNKQVTNNNMFVGSTAELLKMLKEKNNS